VGVGGLSVGVAVGGECLEIQNSTRRTLWPTGVTTCTAHIALVIIRQFEPFFGGVVGGFSNNSEPKYCNNFTFFSNSSSNFGSAIIFSNQIVNGHHCSVSNLRFFCLMRQKRGEKR
jgi:hypothetical protein